MDGAHGLLIAQIVQDHVCVGTRHIVALSDFRDRRGGKQILANRRTARANTRLLMPLLGLLGMFCLAHLKVEEREEALK